MDSVDNRPNTTIGVAYFSTPILAYFSAPIDNQMKKLLSGSSFSWDELLDGKVDIYIVIPQDMIEHLSGFMRLVMNMVLGSVTRQDGRRKVKDRILCVLDEFTRLGRMEKILEIATIAAGGGVEAVFIAQDLGALEETYGAAPTRTILGSCASLRIFGLGAGDERTAQWAESLLPSHEIERWNETIDRSGNKTWTKQIDKAPLLSKAELLEIPATAMLCRFRANPGILLDQIISHQHHQYRNRLSENPVVRA